MDVEIFSTIASIIAIIASIYACWRQLILPKLRKVKLRRLYDLISDWYCVIETNDIDNINMTLLNAKENKIREYIVDHKLDQIRIKIDQKFVSRFLKQCGIKKELRNSFELFTHFSRIESSEMFVDLFWLKIMSNFYKFYGNYKAGESANIADVEMPIKALKMLINVKAN